MYNFQSKQFSYSRSICGLIDVERLIDRGIQTILFHHRVSVRHITIKKLYRLVIQKLPHPPSGGTATKYSLVKIEGDKFIGSFIIRVEWDGENSRINLSVSDFAYEEE